MRVGPRLIGKKRVGTAVSVKRVPRYYALSPRGRPSIRHYTVIPRCSGRKHGKKHPNGENVGCPRSNWDGGKRREASKKKRDGIRLCGSQVRTDGENRSQEEEKPPL